MSNQNLQIMEKQDFIKIGKNKYQSKNGEYQIYQDSHGFWYPSHLFYKNVTIEEGNFFSNMVHVSYDYCFDFETCLKILNMVLKGEWKHGQGTYLNGLR